MGHPRIGFIGGRGFSPKPGFNKLDEEFEVRYRMLAMKEHAYREESDIYMGKRNFASGYELLHL